MIKLVLKDSGSSARLIIKEINSITQCSIDLSYCVKEVPKSMRRLWLDSWKYSPAPPFVARF